MFPLANRLLGKLPTSWITPGHTAAVNSVDIRPRVTGYLTEMPFKEGDDVKKDQLLFQIDPRPYQALVDQAEAQVNLNEAKLRLAKANNTRARTIASREPGAFSQQELDTYQAQELESDAAVKSSKASLATYKLNLSFCRVASPIDGQISRYYYTVGNLVNQDQTPLTTVVSVDPIYVYFDMDERTGWKSASASTRARFECRKTQAEIPVSWLEGETDHPQEGNTQLHQQPG